jgi:phosphinothricin acetyltransferase
MHTTRIRLANPEDAEAIAGIYNPYVLDTPVSFEEEPVSVPEMAERIEEVLLSGLPWLVAERNDEIVAYAYASKWTGRCAYRFSVEASIYASRKTHRSGLGTALYTVLIEHLRALNTHVVIGGIALPNPASISLHEKLGFEKVAHFKQVGFKRGKWRDVGYWQLTLGENLLR